MTDESPRRNPLEPVGSGGRSLLMKRILIGGAVVLLIPSGAIFVWAWMRGEVFNIATLPMERPAPMSLDAAFAALSFPFLFALFLGLPLFALWSIYCVIAAWAEKR